jgi:hypothetical protein
MPDGREISQSKFVQTDNFAIKFHYTVSPDLGNTNTRYQYAVDFEYLGTYYQPTATRYYRASFGFTMGHRPATYSGRLPHAGTNWVTSINYYDYLTEAPNGMMSYRVIIDIDGRYDLPAISDLGIVAIGNVSNWS